jgi:outer membrane protein TolC
VIESVSRLQLLVADYPDGGWPLSRELPVIEASIPVGIPSDLLTRRPDIQQTWFNLLSADLSLAVAHKQRFPRLTLNASMSDDANNFSDLLANGSLARSLITNIALPLFQGGRLVAAEEQARQRVIQLEQQYLNAVNNAFSEVERAITRQDRLRRRYDSFLKAEQNAIAAYELSFEQYQSGLSEYQTILESQRRAFDSQNTVIDLRNQLLQNRITLYQSLGGDFGADIIEHASSFENLTSTENVTSEKISEQVSNEQVILVGVDK